MTPLNASVILSPHGPHTHGQPGRPAAGCGASRGTGKDHQSRRSRGIGHEPATVQATAEPSSNAGATGAGAWQPRTALSAPNRRGAPSTCGGVAEWGGQTQRPSHCGPAQCGGTAREHGYGATAASRPEVAAKRRRRPPQHRRRRQRVARSRLHRPISFRSSSVTTRRGGTLRPSRQARSVAPPHSRTHPGLPPYASRRTRQHREYPGALGPDPARAASPFLASGSCRSTRTVRWTTAGDPSHPRRDRRATRPGGLVHPGITLRAAGQAHAARKAPRRIDAEPRTPSSPTQTPASFHRHRHLDQYPPTRGKSPLRPRRQTQTSDSCGRSRG